MKKIVKMVLFFDVSKKYFVLTLIFCNFEKILFVHTIHMVLVYNNNCNGNSDQQF